MKVPLVLVVALASTACVENVEPNGSWTSPDASVVFFDWDGGTYWWASHIYLRHSFVLFDKDCSRFATSGSRLTWLRPFPPSTPAVQNGNVVRLLLPISDFDANQGYQLAHPDAGTVGLVKMTFDAGFFIEGPQRGVLRWRADYRDDVRQLESEGGEIWLDQHQSFCR